MSRPAAHPTAAPSVPAADPSLAADAAALQRALSEFMRIVQFRDRDRICCHDVSVTQCYALEALVELGPLTLGELAARLYLDKSTASRVVDALEAKDYAERRPHPRDGRARLLAATGAGRRLKTLIESDLRAEAAAMLAGVEPEVRQGTARLLAGLARAVEARMGCGPSACSRC
jgi:DNA-binding MarR family transcriptional regulator